MVIVSLLFFANITDSDTFNKPTPTFFIMRLVTAYLFHIFALEDGREAYQKLKFLLRYPERFERKLRFSVLIICLEQFSITMAVEYLNLMFLCK